jgi:hypothetical protein
MEPRGRALAFHPGSCQRLANDQVTPAQCEGVVTDRLESPIGVENCLVEQSPEAHTPDGLNIDRTPVRDRRDVPERILNATRSDQKLTKRQNLEHCDPVTLTTSPDAAQP